MISSQVKLLIPTINYKHSQQTAVKKSINASNLFFFFKKPQISNIKEKKMPLKLFEFLEQLMIETFLINQPITFISPLHLC